MPNPMIGEERAEVVRVRERFAEALFKVKEFRGETYLCLDKSKLVEVVRFLKEDPELQYVYFSECLGADYSRWQHERDFPNRFEVIYNLMSLKHASRIFLKIGVDDGETAPTLKHVFLGAEYPEREVWDLFGVIFLGNEQTQRFLMPDDWVGFPLRKEFPLGGEDIPFASQTLGPAVEDRMQPRPGESFNN